MPELFCNGGAMRGGDLHHTIAAHAFLGDVVTAPSYRFYSVREEFPALELTRSGGVSIAGELYDVPLEVIRTRFLPAEPPELELTVVELADGRSVLGVGLRPGLAASVRADLTDISEHGSWRRYREQPAARAPRSRG